MQRREVIITPGDMANEVSWEDLLQTLGIPPKERQCTGYVRFTAVNITRVLYEHPPLTGESPGGKI